MKGTCLAIVSLCFTGLTVTAGPLDATVGNWQIVMSTGKTLTIKNGAQTLLQGVYASARNATDMQIDTKDYPNISLTTENINDAFGNGVKAT